MNLIQPRFHGCLLEQAAKRCALGGGDRRVLEHAARENRMTKGRKTPAGTSQLPLVRRARRRSATSAWRGQLPVLGRASARHPRREHLGEAGDRDLNLWNDRSTPAICTCGARRNRSTRVLEPRRLPFRFLVGTISETFQKLTAVLYRNLLSREPRTGSPAGRRRVLMGGLRPTPPRRLGRRPARRPRRSPPPPVMAATSAYALGSWHRSGSTRTTTGPADRPVRADRARADRPLAGACMAIWALPLDQHDLGGPLEALGDDPAGSRVHSVAGFGHHRFMAGPAAPDRRDGRGRRTGSI